MSSHELKNDHDELDDPSMTGWADSISRVLGSRKTILSKAKKDTDITLEEDEPILELVDKEGNILPGEQDDKKKKKKTIKMQHKEELAKKRAKALEKRVWEEIAHGKIEDEDPIEERRIKTMAKYAYIKFCESVAKAQKVSEKPKSLKRPASGVDVGVSEAMLLDEYVGGLPDLPGSDEKGRSMTATTKEKKAETPVDQDLSKKRKMWSICSDLYLLDNKMQNWDLKVEQAKN